MKIMDAVLKAKDGGEQVVGYILEEAASRSPQAREIIEQDLDNKEMTLDKAFAAIYNYAKAHRKNNCWACQAMGFDPTNEAVRVILDFYKITAFFEDTKKTQALGQKNNNVVDLMDFI